MVLRFSILQTHLSVFILYQIYQQQQTSEFQNRTVKICQFFTNKYISDTFFLWKQKYTVYFKSMYQ